MKNYLLFSFLLFSGALSAQVPGFMGKRFTVFLEANPTPAFFVQNSNNQVVGGAEFARTEDVNRFAFTFRPQITFEYLVHRDISLGLSYSRISIGTIHGYREGPDDLTFVHDQDVIKGQSLGLHLKFYQFENSGSIAPIGFYQTFSVYGTQTNTYDTKKSKDKLFKNDFLYPVATVGMGRQSMIAKNVLLKTGFELGWAFVPGNWIQEDPNEWTAQEFAGYNVHQSLFGHYMISINIAVGYIAF